VDKESTSHVEAGQVERARRLRDKIEQLKTGTPPKPSTAPKSIKEQIHDRTSGEWGNR
jgi:hypothetical protein